MKRILLYLVALGLFAACDKEKEYQEPPGRQSDTIGLSAKAVNADSAASVTEITTKGKFWWLLDIRIGEDVFQLSEDAEQWYAGKLEVEYKDDYLPGEMTPVRVEGDWFIITRELQRIQIELEPNPTEQDRNFSLTVQAGNYFDYIRVRQAGAKP